MPRRLGRQAWATEWNPRRIECARDRQAALGTVYSNESGRSYRLERLIGRGGFGEIYLATPTPAGILPSQVSVKISHSIAGWLREAYFAQLLARQSRALRVYDRFVEADAMRSRYCLVMEYAEHGDLAAWLGSRGPQSERFVRHDIAAILGTLDVVHRGQAMHRDLTPFNVFVCEDETLKLGDFGIATHQASRRGVTADAFNPLQAPTEIAWGKMRKWLQRDDVYQVGQLIAMLLRGDVKSPMRSKDVRTLPCSDHLKEVVHRCLGARAKRYEAADEVIAALKHRPKEVKSGRSGASRVAQSRSPGSSAARARRRSRQPGKPAPASRPAPARTPKCWSAVTPTRCRWLARRAGSCCWKIRRLAAKGHRVTIIGEEQFWRLAKL